MLRFTHISIGLLSLLLLVTACRKASPACEVLALPRELDVAPRGFPPLPFPAANAYTAARWRLGKKLFYDPVLSIDGSLSCGSCHQAEFAFADDRAFSPGVANRAGTRNAPALINLAYQPYFLREGGLPTLEMQILVPIQEENEFDHNIVDIAEVLKLDPEYVRMSQEAYAREPDAFVITRAIATFERTLVSGNSAYDKAEFQQCQEALTVAQQRGKALFFGPKANCSHCHNGLNFTNNAFENNGLYETYADVGRMRLSKDSADLARFKVPSLRNVALTAPYMHDGSITTLEAVISHYDQGGFAHPNKNPILKPIGLSQREKEDLLQFLNALTDTDFISDPRFQDN